MTDIWAEGKYIDTWTINHLLSGFIAAGWLAIWGSPLWLILLLSSILFWGWEISERILDIEEIPNQVMDLVADYTGFVIFLLTASLLQSYLLVSVIIVSILFLFLEISGYLAYQKRSKHSNLLPTKTSQIARPTDLKEVP
jgi:hypothetical protein